MDDNMDVSKKRISRKIDFDKMADLLINDKSGFIKYIRGCKLRAEYKNGKNYNDINDAVNTCSDVEGLAKLLKDIFKSLGTLRNM